MARHPRAIGPLPGSALRAEREQVRSTAEQWSAPRPLPRARGAVSRCADAGPATASHGTAAPASADHHPAPGQRGPRASVAPAAPAPISTAVSRSATPRINRSSVAAPRRLISRAAGPDRKEAEPRRQAGPAASSVSPTRGIGQHAETPRRVTNSRRHSGHPRPRPRPQTTTTATESPRYSGCSEARASRKPETGEQVTAQPVGRRPQRRPAASRRAADGQGEQPDQRPRLTAAMGSSATAATGSRPGTRPRARPGPGIAGHRRHQRRPAR